MSRLRPGRALGLVVALLLSGALAAEATTPAPGRSGDAPTAARTAEAAVARAAAVCPDPVARDAETVVAAAAPGPPEGVVAARTPGRLLLAGLLGEEAVGTRAVAPASVTVPGAGAALVARGTGRSAAGLAAAQLTSSTSTAQRGLAGVRCAVPGTDAWFVGSGAVVGRRGRVYLTNADAAPALVDVDLYGPDGPLPAPDAQGVTVAPGRQEVRLLDALAPGTTRFAVHVRVRQGRVAAAVRDLQVDGLTALGADWVPPAAPPARRVVVPGVPDGPGERLLQVVAPGEGDAIVRVRLVTASGLSTPDGPDVVEVAAGSVAEVDLAPFTDGEPVSVELRADVPVTAGVLARTEAGPDGTRELAYAAAVLPLLPGTPGTAPLVRAGGDSVGRLRIAAPDGDATVFVRPLPPVTGDPVEVRVPGGSQVEVNVTELTGTATPSLVLEPAAGSGPVHAAVQVEAGGTAERTFTVSPVEPGRYRVDVPRVVADLSTGLRAR